MTTAVVTCNTPMDSDAKFRTLAGIGTAIVSFGWVRCSDSGQINWTTVTKPTSGTYVQSGYEIFRMADTHQAAAPIFMRIDYGIGSSVQGPCLWVTLGTGTDGAGNLTGALTSAARMPSNATTGPTNEVLMSGGPGRLSLAAQTWEFMFSVERFKDSAGSDTALGISMLAFATANGANTGSKVNTFSPVAYNHTIRSKAPALLPDGANWQNGSNVGISPIIPCGVSLLNPLVEIMAYLDADIVAGNQISLTTYGTARNYYALGARGSTGGGTNTNMRFLMRYE